MFDTSISILVIDDMTTMRKIVIKSLKDLGFGNITEAADGEQAWGLLSDANAKFNLVLSDWNMPKLTGIELLKKVRADAKLKALPFLLITAESESQQVVEAIKVGVTGYLVKPFNANSLKEKLEEAAKKAA